MSTAHARELRDRRMNQTLDEIIDKECEDFRHEAVERRKAEKEKADNRADSSGEKTFKR